MAWRSPTREGRKRGPRSGTAGRPAHTKGQRCPRQVKYRGRDASLDFQLRCAAQGSHEASHEASQPLLFLRLYQSAESRPAVASPHNRRSTRVPATTAGPLSDHEESSTPHPVTHCSSVLFRGPKADPLLLRAHVGLGLVDASHLCLTRALGLVVIREPSRPSCCAVMLYRKSKDRANSLPQERSTKQTTPVTRIFSQVRI